MLIKCSLEYTHTHNLVRVRCMQTKTFEDRLASGLRTDGRCLLLNVEIDIPVGQTTRLPVRSRITLESNLSPTRLLQWPFVLFCPTIFYLAINHSVK